MDTFRTLCNKVITLSKTLEHNGKSCDKKTGLPVKHLTTTSFPQPTTTTMAPNGRRTTLPSNRLPSKRNRHGSVSSERSTSSEGSTSSERSISNTKRITGIDIGSSFSSMVITTENGKPKDVDRYPGAPQTHGGSGDELKEVPSTITLIIEGGRVVKCEYGYRKGAVHGTTVTFDGLKLMMGMADEDDGDAEEYREARSANLEKLADANRHLTEAITFEGLVTQYIKYMRDHLVWWCSKTGEIMPTRTVATYPLRWKARTILSYQKIIEQGGWKEVFMRNEGEAALDAVLLDKETSWFPKTVLLVDCGGSTFDLVVDDVEKAGKVIIKGERMVYGGAGGMAVVIHFATPIIEQKIRRSTKLSEYVDWFALAVRSYVPPEQMTQEEKDGDVGGLEFGNPPIMFSHHEMAFLRDAGLSPIFEAMRRFREAFKAHGVEEVFLVGGTSKSERWFQPAMEAALGDLTVTYPALPSSTLIASGATRAIDQNFVTSSRLNRLHIGMMVSRDRKPHFTDSALWGKPRGNDNEVIEIVKLKGGSLFADPKKAPWHWLKIENLRDSTFGNKLKETEIRVFATDKEKKELRFFSDPHYNTVASRLAFDIEFESRRVFSKPEIEKFLQVVYQSQKRWEYFYAIRLYDHPEGIGLEVGYQEDLTKNEDGIKARDLGCIKFVVSS